MDINNPNNSFFLPKWLVNTLGGLLVIFIAILIVQKFHDLQTQFVNAKPANTISVSADGKVTAVPDLATVTLGVLTQGADLTTVKNQNNDKVNAITQFVKQQGIDQKDINTSQYNIYPTQDYTNGQQKITGYQSNQTITVKVHGVDKDQSVLEKILDGAVNAGANQVQGVYFSIADPNSLQQQARLQAIDNAKAKAADLAKQAGLTLGKVVSISETNSATPVPIPYAYGMGGGGVAEKSVAPNIEPGSQDITESMTVTFEVK